MSSSMFAAFASGVAAISSKAPMQPQHTAPSTSLRMRALIW